MYTIDKLNNGINVVMENVDYVSSVSIGVLVKCGVIKEIESYNGVSHFIEHMLFKGTTKLSAKQIVESIDDIGGNMNAFTSKEHTCYYINVLDQHLSVAIELLGEMINNSLFNEEEIEKEKNVIIEEINMYKDTPDDLVFEILNAMMYESTSLGLPILGEKNTIKSLSKDIILGYFNDNYTADNIIISIAGSFDVKETMKMLNNHFCNISPKSNIIEEAKINYNFTNKIKGISKNIEQLNISLGLEGVSYKSDNLYAALVINNLFGGSMSSRLFQNIREIKGFVYAIDSHLTSYNQVGSFEIYAGLNSKLAVDVFELINDEIDNIKKNSITNHELSRSKEQLKGNFILGIENSSSRMFENAKSMAIYNTIETPKDILKKIDDVSMDDILISKDILFNKESLNIAYVGPISDPVNYENQMKKIFNMR